MAAKRTDMHRIQEVVRLHRLGTSARNIARQLSMGRDTIRAALTSIERAGLLDGAPDALPELDALASALHDDAASPPAPSPSSVSEWIAEIVRLREKGAGPTAIHDYLRVNASGYAGSLSAIKRVCVRLERESGPLATDVAIPVETLPGEVAQVDFGYAGKRYDPERGVLRKSWVFVMTLGYSRRTFCTLTFDQSVATWIRVHIAAFEYFGGVPRVIVPDNLKAAVIRAAFAVDDDPLVQRSYRELARHYSFQIDPAPPRAPKKKGKVEASVRYVKNNFLRAWGTVDIRADEEALQRWTREVADVRTHATTARTPLALFEAHERAALLPLPKQRFETVIWKRARLHTDAHVQIDGAFYSAPWRLLHQEVWVRCTPHTIAIFHEDAHQVTHARVRRGVRSTVETHLPDHRRDLRERSREHWVERAKKVGDEIEQLVESIFAEDDVLTQLRRVQAIVTHLESFPRERARAAAQRALRFGCRDYLGIKNILKHGLDLEPVGEVRTRAWSKGARFARRPNTASFGVMETKHVHHG